MAEFDLTSTISKFLDRHLVIPLFEFLQFREVYDENELLDAKYKVLLKTNMVDLTMEIHEKLFPEETGARDEMAERRAAVVARYKELEQATMPIGEIFNKEEVQVLLQDEKLSGDSGEMLKALKEHGFRSEHLQQMYEFARFLYDIGNYALAEEWLYNYYTFSDDPTKTISALWGKFASDILLQEWNAAFDAYKQLKDIIDPSDGKAAWSPLQQLQQRTWLIHWCLFVFFNHDEGRDEIVDLFLSNANYANAIQTTCPHILRYVTAAVITNKRRRSELRALVKMIQQETNSYRDPVTEFLECLYVNYDFDGAQQKLRECEKVLANDIFLVSCQEEFIENARLFIFETYCRIHNTISIKMLAEKLNMDTEQAERWIVNLIRNAKLDAKLDSQAGNVVMATQVPSVYSQVIEKTKHLTMRSTILMENIDAKKSHANRTRFEFH